MILPGQCASALVLTAQLDGKMTFQVCDLSIYCKGVCICVCASLDWLPQQGRSVCIGVDILPQQCDLLDPLLRQNLDLWAAQVHLGRPAKTLQWSLLNCYPLCFATLHVEAGCAAKRTYLQIRQPVQMA